MPDEEPSAFRPGDVSYLRIPAPDCGRTAAFYHAVFGWRLLVTRLAVATVSVRQPGAQSSRRLGGRRR